MISLWPDKAKRQSVCDLCGAASAHFRDCADCDYVIGRCADHGDRRGVSRSMVLHRQREHGSQFQIFGTATAIDPILEMKRPEMRAECEPCAVCQEYFDSSEAARAFFEASGETLACGHRVADAPNHFRPCPWVGCRHHTLIEIAQAKPRTQIDDAGRIVTRDARPTTIRLNRAPEHGVMGRRPGLRADDNTETVQRWVDDAVEHLETMPYTCSLDVPLTHADGYPLVAVAALLGVTTAAIKEEVGPAAIRLRDGLSEYADHSPVDHSSLLARAQSR